MTGIGNPYQIASLSNCFVIGNEGASDSYGGIMKIDEEQVQLMKRRGGVGHDLSHIRPKGSPVKNSALTSTGLVPFMERYSNSTREVAQDGRRGALMLSVSIAHPDAVDFIDAKLEQGKVTGANISVRIDDKFMQAVEQHATYTQQFPVHSDAPKVKKEVDAVAIWKKIVHNAWKSAEPGILFWDTIIRESLPDCYADLRIQNRINESVRRDSVVSLRFLQAACH
jgi:ribonucleoside-diphosphate reductase alpha chain